MIECQLIRKRFAFCIIKATEGNDFTDENYKSNEVKARKAGIVVGAYHRFTKSDPTLQFQHFSRSVRILPGDLPPMLDVGGVKNVDNIHQWLHLTLQKYGVTPLVYARSSFFGQFL